MKRFMVATDDLTSEQSLKFIDFLKESETGWWHYLKNFWLLDTDDEDLTADLIRDKLVDEIAPKTNCLVIEVTGDTYWAGFGPSGDKRNMFKWFEGHWKGPNEV
jgi:hypothetical protein